MNIFEVWPVKTLHETAILCLFFALVSAVWIESDAYRYAAIILVLWGLVIYWQAVFKPSIGWMGFACLGWVAFVAMRFAVLYEPKSPDGLGTSEGIYLLPIFYITIGYMMFLYRDTMRTATRLFVLVSFAMVASTVQLFSVFDGNVHDFLVMERTIHSSAGGGLIILAAMNFASFASKNMLIARERFCYEAMSYMTILLCLVGLYGAKSKGVWVAIVVAIFVQILLSARGTHARNWVMLAVFLVALGSFAFFFGSNMLMTIRPSYESAVEVTINMLKSGHPLDAIQSAVASGTVPTSMNERLMLWYNAVEVWSHNILFGNGIAWKDLWTDAYYQDVGYDIIHSGYLEIVVRYGLVGLLFYAVLYGWSISMSYRAFSRGLVAREAFNFHTASLVFFLVTNMTNSNNRLAIGESYMLVAAAYGFYCHYMCQYQQSRQSVKGPETTLTRTAE